MLRSLALAALLLLVPGSVAAQDDPLRVCTQLVYPAGMMSALVDSPVSRAEPPDGGCDVVLYLPFALADIEVLVRMNELLEQAQASPATDCPRPITLEDPGC